MKFLWKTRTTAENRNLRYILYYIYIWYILYTWCCHLDLLEIYVSKQKILKCQRWRRRQRRLRFLYVTNIRLWTIPNSKQSHFDSAFEYPYRGYDPWYNHYNWNDFLTSYFSFKKSSKLYILTLEIKRKMLSLSFCINIA